MVLSRSANLRCAAGTAVHRARDPVIPRNRAADMRRWIAAVDVFHDVELAARRPVDRDDVVAEQPERGPHALRLRKLDARLDAAVHETETALRFEAGGRVDPG